MTHAPILKKNKKKQRKKAKKEMRFHRLWNKVNKQKRLNSEFSEKLQSFAERIETEMAPFETELIEVDLSRNARLIQFFGRKSMPAWLRAELYSIIVHNFEKIESSPFADQKLIRPLKDQFLEQVIIWYPDDCEDYDENPEGWEEDEESQHDEPSVEKSRVNEEDDLYGGEDLFGSLDEQFAEFEEMLESETDDPESMEDIFEHLFDEFDFDAEDDFRQKQEKDKRMEVLLKQSSINGMFRRIAKVIHPDKELDELLKEEKHKLMSQLLAARSEGDVLTLFAMYMEHVGEAPENVVKEDLDSINELLEYQLQKLELEYEDIPHQSHRISGLFCLFYDDSEKGIQRNIRRRKKEISESIKKANAFLAEVTSVAKLNLTVKDEYRRMEEELLDAANIR